MSKNNSPQARPGPIRRRRAKTQTSTAAPTRDIRQSKLRRCVPAILIPHGVALLLVLIAAVASLMFTDTSMVALPATIAQLWLALNLSPVSGSGEIVGVMPMLPALVLAGVIARRVHGLVRERASLVDLGIITTTVLAVPLVLTLVAVLMLYDASEVLPVGPPPAASSVGRVLLLHAAALVLGMGSRLWRALARRYGVPGWFVDSAVQGMRFLGAFAVASAVIVAAMLVVNHQEFAATLSGFGEAGAPLALIVLSLLYLPNIVVYGMGILAGAPLYFGEASISLFSVRLVPLPPLPILAALPTQAPVWAMALLVVPAAIAIHVSLKHPLKLPVQVVAALFSATFFVVLALLAGGHLGVYGRVGLNLYAAFGLLLCYLLVVALLIAGLDRLRSATAEERRRKADTLDQVPAEQVEAPEHTENDHDAQDEAPEHTEHTENDHDAQEETPEHTEHTEVDHDAQDETPER
ncbi:DUF6350 family protein [Corynebacterium pacaense]|uniref:cell division protein PerM n=1 Tax=Corynebacterium pacaense TaxID=1816684 RepID=UPI0011784603|nr:DUF6350 family protein [Corynebacterium pacaense]